MPTSTNDHPDPIQLTAFLDGRLPERDRVAIERHVETCDDCCAAMSEMPQGTLSDRLLNVDTDPDHTTRDDTGRDDTGREHTNTDNAATVEESPSLPQDDPSAIPPALRDHPRYRILGPLGKGGMGVVYKAEHRMMDREVALKVIDSRFIENPQAIERFRTEVKAAAKLNHANIVRAYDAEQADNLHFLVMEYVDGISLAELIRRNGQLPVHQVCGIIRKVAQGLHHAFEAGMVHRDIKPQNIMVTGDGRIRILDFGLARLARERESTAPVQPGDSHQQMRRTADTLTLVGSVLGTPDYIAPEQAMDARQADTRSDIYSLGCTCYFLLTGSPPYPSGTVIQKLLAHTESTPSPIADLRSGIPADVIAITQRMMERQPEERYQTPREVAQAMDDFMKSGPSATTETIPANQTAASTLNDQASPFSDPELRKLGLATIPAEDSDFLTSLDGSLGSTRDASTQPQHQKRATLPEAMPGRKRNTGFTWGIATAVILSAAVVAAMFAIPSTDQTTGQATDLVERSPDRQGTRRQPRPVETTAASDSPSPPVAEGRSGKWVDLLQAVNPAKDAQRGEWELNGGDLTVGPQTWARISLPVDVPDQYDFEVDFIREQGSDSIALIFCMNGHQATLDIDAWRKHMAGIQNVDGLSCEHNGLGVNGITLAVGERHTARIRVLSNRVEAYFDGRSLKHYNGDGSNLSLHENWQLPDSNSIGLGSYQSVFRFHRVRIRPLHAPSRE